MKKMTLCAMALCALSVAACADRMNKTSSNDMTGSAYAPMSAPTPSTSSTSAQSSSPSSGQTSTSTSTSTAQTSYGVVQAIDQLQRQDVGVGMLGAAAAGGSTGAPTDKVYRITMRMEDGGTQVVVVESEPTYKIGDRVRYSNGTVQSY